MNVSSGLALAESQSLSARWRLGERSSYNGRNVVDGEFRQAFGCMLPDKLVPR
jgi:hypothetical protein